jgi:menaquinone-dependent protoporphyrinogen oxidase
MSQTRILVAFHTTEGQTAKIADRIAEVLRDSGVHMDVHPVASAPAPDGYDGVVVGGSIHTGKYGGELVDYLRDHAHALDSMPSALFQVSLTSANPDEDHTAQAQQLVHELLDDTGFDPDLVAMFAGAVVYTKYGWVKRRIMRAIVAVEDVEADPTQDHEYTDWAAVEHFAADVQALVRTRSVRRRP